MAKTKKQGKKNKSVEKEVKTMHVHDGACGCSGIKDKQSHSGCGCC